MSDTKRKAISPIQSSAKKNTMTKKLSELTLGDLNECIENNNRELVESINVLIVTINKLVEDNEDLKTEVIKLQKEKEEDRSQMMFLEDQIRKRNLVFRGIDSHASIKTAVLKTCTEKLKVERQIVIKSTKKIFDRDGKMAVIAEFDSDDMIGDILRATRELHGTTISIEKDLSKYRQEQKKAMMQLKREILSKSQQHRITVRNDQLRINDKWISWGKQKKLVYGNQEGVAAIKGLYESGVLDGINFDFKELLDKSNSK